MNRRKALQKISIAAGGVLLLPMWMRASGFTLSHQHLTSFTGPEQEILAALADTIIPAGSSVGALTVEVDKYLQKLFDDCYDEDARNNIRRQLEGINKKAHETHSAPFASCSQQQRLKLLRNMRASSDIREKEFIELLRRETIRGFTTSQKVLQDHLGYEVAPGRYHGCVSIKS